MAEAAREVVDYMLFLDEAPLADSIRGSTGFSEHFEQQGPFDSRGRSLRQLHLRRRLMRYPCSYVIYSPSFDGLPVIARDAIYERLWQALSGSVRPRHRHLSVDERRAIVEILNDTKRDLPSTFRRRVS